ncbi:HepT-like ribonuclease domain-containing protein [Methylorubrum rhodesianum]|jgi:hypothetical protein|uniref:Uncharacterized protein n=1 Tax=Methylorubrum rhodesianum TaxID=29427 RepID=A0ABU9Z9Z2_9HYPH|nr:MULTISPECIES: HepT-like ribonuclease domain-containing protein [Methylorubrum]MBB5763095.1 hypothetical protein [Methylorubrum rhodesianum]
MNRRDYRHALDDMLGAVDGIAQATAGRSFEAFCSDWLLKHGVERGIEIISEASRAVPDAVKALRPEIPWHQVRAIGKSYGTSITVCPIRSSGTSSSTRCRADASPSKCFGRRPATFHPTRMIQYDSLTFDHRNTLP